MPKKIQRTCGNCKLFNPEKSQCSIVILHEGQRLNLPVEAHEECFFEQQYFDPISRSHSDFAEEIQEVKMWVENDKGEKTDKDGVVKIEYPNGFFGKSIDKII